jgi:hypothetical protein
VQFKFSVYQLDVLGACAKSTDSVLHVRPDAILSSHAARNQQYNGVSFLTECFFGSGDSAEHFITVFVSICILSYFNVWKYIR